MTGSGLARAERKKECGMGVAIALMAICGLISGDVVDSEEVDGRAKKERV